MPLADLEPADSDLLILPGADIWDAGGRSRSCSPRANRIGAEAGVEELRCALETMRRLVSILESEEAG